MKKRIALLLGIILAFQFIGTGNTNPTPDQPPPQFEINWSIGFVDPVLTLEIGIEYVFLVTGDGLQHTFTLDGVFNHPITPSETVTFSYFAPGTPQTLLVYCSFHPSMQLTLNIVDPVQTSGSGSTSPPVSSGGNSGSTTPPSSGSPPSSSPPPSSDTSSQSQSIISGGNSGSSSPVDSSSPPADSNTPNDGPSSSSPTPPLPIFSIFIIQAALFAMFMLRRRN